MRRDGISSDHDPSLTSRPPCRPTTRPRQPDTAELEPTRHSQLADSCASEADRLLYTPAAAAELVHIGDVGTGFTEAERARLLARLETLEQRKHPFAVTPPREDVARAHWVKPELVGEVVFRQFTRGEGRLRHTAWRGLREDRTSSLPALGNASPPKPHPRPVADQQFARPPHHQLIPHRWGPR
jgi:hypothetical protein